MDTKPQDTVTNEGAKKASEPPKVQHEFAFVIYVTADNKCIAQSVSELADAGVKREADIDDIYRAICEVKRDLEARAAAVEVHRMMQAALMANRKAKDSGIVVPGRA